MADRSVFISGSSRGIGAETAKRFAKAGYSAVITYQNSEAEARAVAAECQKLGAPQTLILELDAANDENIARAARLTREKFGTIDVLVNNAGIFQYAPLTGQSLAEIQNQISVNLAGPIKLTRELLPSVKSAVINVGSGLGLVGKGQAVPYSAGKWGIRGFTKSLAKERPALRVYAVHPGLTATSMGNAGGMPPSLVAEIIFNAAEGNYHFKNGSDIDVKYYVLGPAGRLIYALKFVIKKILGRI